MIRLGASSDCDIALHFAQEDLPRDWKRSIEQGDEKCFCNESKAHWAGKGEGWGR